MSAAAPLTEVASGVRLASGWLDAGAQRALLAEIRAALALAPLYCGRMPRSGAPLSVKMSNCGELGWFSDERGYRYIAHHPLTGRPWPPIPEIAQHVWRDLADWPGEPQACLINWYGPQARMGLHQDRDEQDLSAPVVSISLGDNAMFRLGGAKRRDPTRAFPLFSGDVLTLAGPGRLAFHGVDRIEPDSSTLLAEGGRFNLTLRRVTPPP